METGTQQPTTETAPPAANGPNEPAEAASTKPNGPVAAVMIAAGVGAAVLGIVTSLAEASEGFKDFLRWNDGVGPLSGKTSVAVIALVISWAGLHLALRNREMPWRPVVIVLIALLVIGLVFTFPPVFESFAE